MAVKRLVQNHSIELRKAIDYRQKRLIENIPWNHTMDHFEILEEQIERNIALLEEILLACSESLAYPVIYPAEDKETRHFRREKLWDYLNSGLWIYQDAIYAVGGIYSLEEKKLLILEFADKERQQFERLKAKFSGEQAKIATTERKRIPEDVRIAVWRRDQGQCARCGNRENLEYDHIVPVSRGGSNTVRNIELLCERCNREKGDRIQ